jgi:hypothetical protein
MTPKAFHALFGRIGGRAKMPFPIHPHMLRHGCGYALANAGHDTVPYRLGSATRISSTRFAIPSLRRIGSRTFGADPPRLPPTINGAYVIATCVAEKGKRLATVSNMSHARRRLRQVMIQPTLLARADEVIE